jgi:rhomboid family GlyGly-CTERM serine protease
LLCTHKDASPAPARTLRRVQLRFLGSSLFIFFSFVILVYFVVNSFMHFSLKNWREFAPPLSIWLWLAFCGVLVFLPVNDLLRYDRAAFEAGEYWRVLTANMVHSNDIHYLLNAASVLVQSLLFRGLLPTRIWIAVALWCAVLNILGLHWWTPELNWYVGMSGALYGVAIVGAFSLLMNREWLVGGVLANYLTGRIIYEQNFELTDELAHWIDAPVAIDAHLWGLCSGYVAVLAVAFWWQRTRGFGSNR